MATADAKNAGLVKEAVLTLCTVNAKRGFHDERSGRADLDAVMQLIGDQRADIVGFSEAYDYHRFGRRDMFDLANRLTAANGGGYMAPFVAEFAGHGNHPILFVDTSVVRVDEWWEPHVPHTRSVKWGWLRARVHGIPTWLSCQHWQGSLGRAPFWAHAGAMAEMGTGPAIALGDFNTTSGWDGEVPVDWDQATEATGTTHKRLHKGVKVDGKWQVDTEQMDYLLADCGWRDLGELANDSSVTTHHSGSGLRIDRIMMSADFPGELVPGSYQVHNPITGDGRRPLEDGEALDHGQVWPDGPLSDHKMVTAQVRMLGVAA